MMCILDDNVRAAGDGVANDAFVERVIPGGRRGHDDAAFSDGFGKILQVLFLVCNDFTTSFFE
jgi:hypothetical protein